MAARKQTRATAIDAPADLIAAGRLLDQADKHLASAQVAGVDAESRYGMLYDGARKAVDAVLRASGRRLTKGIGHHIEYLAEAKRLMGNEHEQLLTRVDNARRIRNDAQYEIREVTQIELADLQDAAAKLIVAARMYVKAKSA